MFTLDPPLSHINPVHTPTTYFSKIYFNTIQPLPPYVLRIVSSRKDLQPKCCTQISHLSHACYNFCPSYAPWFDHPNHISWRLQITKLLIMQFFSSLVSYVRLT
jgi:hypothetical protein